MFLPTRQRHPPPHQPHRSTRPWVRLGLMLLLLCLGLQSVMLSMQRAGGRLHHHAPVADAAALLADHHSDAGQEADHEHGGSMDHAHDDGDLPLSGEQDRDLADASEHEHGHEHEHQHPHGHELEQAHGHEKGHEHGHGDAHQSLAEHDHAPGDISVVYADDGKHDASISRPAPPPRSTTLTVC
jgi:hypothetical protein